MYVLSCRRKFDSYNGNHGIVFNTLLQHKYAFYNCQWYANTKMFGFTKKMNIYMLIFLVFGASVQDH